MRRYHLVRTATVSALALCSLAGCSTWHQITDSLGATQSSMCPDASILVNTAVLPAFDPTKGSDPTNVTYTAAMTDVSTHCSYSKREYRADSRVDISVLATRPPGGGAEHYRVPYYVAVSTGGDVLDKKLYWLDLEFSAGAATATADETIDSTIVSVARDKHPYDYHLIVGFQLTKAQLDYNSKMGRYAP